MNLPGDNFLFGLFLGFCLGLAVFPVGCLIREILLAIKSLRPLPLPRTGFRLAGTTTGLRGWRLSPAPRPNVRKLPGGKGYGAISVLLFRPRPHQP